MWMHLGLTLLAALPLWGEGWNREKAVAYLETRQQQWAEWKPAQKAGGPCLSCHTGLSYLLARHVSPGAQPGAVEKQLVEGVRTRLLEHKPQSMLSNIGVEAVLQLFALSTQRTDRNAPLSAADSAALQRLWQIQLREGPDQGAWPWYSVDLHPFESEHSVFFGAALAERALAAYPAGSATGIDALRSYLRKSAAAQPLHNRLAWIAFSPSAKEARSGVLGTLWAAQASDGGWAIAALGPWTSREKAPPDSGSNAYATAWAAFAAREAGVGCAEPGMRRALDWLRRHQDAASGAWNAVSMNKVYPEGSMQRGFMTDAATGFAAAVLSQCERKSVAH